MQLAPQRNLFQEKQHYQGQHHQYQAGDKPLMKLSVNPTFTASSTAWKAACPCAPKCSNPACILTIVSCDSNTSGFSKTLMICAGSLCLSPDGRALWKAGT